MLQYGKIDLFAIPVSLFATRRQQYSGSKLGIVLTVWYILLIGAYLIYQTTDMLNNKEDKYSS